MEREKQLINAAENYYKDSDFKDLKILHFMNGANWADENPKEGLVSIDEACEWLSKILYIHKEEIEDKHWNITNTFEWVTSDYDSVIDFIDDFRKAMEK